MTQTRRPPETKKEGENVQFAVFHLELAPAKQKKHMAE